MVSALAYAFAFRWAAFYAANQIDTDPEYIVVLYAIPTVSSIVSIIFLSMHKRLVMPSFIWERISASWRRMQERLLAATSRSGGGAAQ
jgi:lipopolysaccharide export system permease protein